MGYQEDKINLHLIHAHIMISINMFGIVHLQFLVIQKKI